MAVCLDYQTVYLRKESSSLGWHISFASLAILLGTLIGQIWIRTQVTDLGYHISEQQRIQSQLTIERQELELEQIVLHRPDNLAERGRTVLGLRPAKKDQLFRIEE